MGRFEIEWLASDVYLASLTALPGARIDQIHARKRPHGIVLEMDRCDLLTGQRPLQRRIGYLLTRPIRRPPKKPIISCASLRYQAKDWTRPHRVVPRVGCIVTNLSRSSERVVSSTTGVARRNGSKKGKNPLRWTRLSCRTFRHNAVRLGFTRSPQHRELPAHAGFAERVRTVVTDDAPRRTGQDRHPNRAPPPIRDVHLADVAVPRVLFAKILRRSTACGYVRRRSRHEEPER